MPFIALLIVPAKPVTCAYPDRLIDHCHIKDKIAWKSVLVSPEFPPIVLVSSHSLRRSNPDCFIGSNNAGDIIGRQSLCFGVGLPLRRLQVKLTEAHRRADPKDAGLFCNRSDIIAHQAFHLLDGAPKPANLIESR